MLEPIAFAPLALSAWNLLAPFIKKMGGKLLEKAGESLPDVVGKVWDLVKEKMESKPETQQLPADLAAAPEDPAVQGAFQYQLKKLLENDEAFAKRLDELVKNAKQVTSYSAALEGDGAVALGENAKAVGAGGVMIGGNVSGSNIVTGNNNVVNAEKKRRKK